MIHSEVLAALTTMGDTNQTQFQGPQEEIDEMEKGIREDIYQVVFSGRISHRQREKEFAHYNVWQSRWICMVSIDDSPFYTFW